MMPPGPLALRRLAEAAPGTAGGLLHLHDVVGGPYCGFVAGFLALSCHAWRHVHFVGWLF